MKIMIIDDSKTARLFVKKTLLMALGSSDIKVDIVETDNGENALLALANDHQFDLILSDVNMPVMSGFTFMHNLRLKSDLMKIPVVFVTSLSNSGNQHNLIELGAYAVISKPVSVAVLDEILTSLNLKTHDTDGGWGN